MDCELSLIEDDKYLVPLLRECNNEDLEFLVELIKDRTAEELKGTEKFKKYYPDHQKYCDEISAEIQCFAGNTIFNILTGEGVPYERIVKKVAKRLKIEDYSDLSVEDTEFKILEKVLETAYDKADEKTKKEMIDSLGEFKGEFKDYAKYSKQAFMSAVQIAIKMGGFKSYQIAMIVANAIVKQITGSGLKLAANAGITRAISVFAGPIGWAITAFWTLFDIAGPAYRIIIPAVIYISSIRLKNNNK